MKEFIYLGYYFDENGFFVLKVGTTNNLERRAKEHTRNYKKPSANNRMPSDEHFHYIWSLAISKYNTFRFEDRIKEEWREKNFGRYVANDRFVFNKIPTEVNIKIRKNYLIDII